MKRFILKLSEKYFLDNRKSLLLLMLVLFANFGLAQSSGIFESYAILSLNSGANQYYDMQATTGNPDFQVADLGSFIVGSNTLVVEGGQNKTYKNGGCNINLHKMCF
jgi:hypothetical protein